MPDIKLIMAQQVARAAIAFQRERTGQAPEAVTEPAGAARVQDFHRRPFATSSAPLRLEVEPITGVHVREAAAEVETATGTVVHAFTSGTMVQVFLLSQNVRLQLDPSAGSPLKEDVQSC